MALYFSRLQLFEASFFKLEDVPNAESDTEKKASGEVRPIQELYKVTTTTRKRSILPQITTIEYFDPCTSDDDEKHEPGRVVAIISWNWPSQESSLISIGGKVMKINEFLKRGKGFSNTDTNLNVGDKTFTWKSAVFRPAQMYDSNGRSIARYSTKSGYFKAASKLKGVAATKETNEKANSKQIFRSIRASKLELNADALEDQEIRDYAVVSFFVYKACRDLSVLLTPWWRKEPGDIIGLKL